MPILVLKSINRCNADCIYCNADKKGRLNRLGIDVMTILYNKVNQYLTTNVNESVEIQWHGGEPLLLGPKFFSEVSHIQDTICETTKDRIQHSMQSNLTLLNQDYLESLTRLGLKSIGTSCEFFSSMRVLKKKTDEDLYNKKFLNGLRLLEAYPIRIGINYVVTKKTLSDPEMIFYYLTNVNPQGIISFNPVIIRDHSLQHLDILPEEFNSFIQHLYSLWEKNMYRYASMEPFNTLWETGESLSKNESLNNHIDLPVMLNPNGEYYHFKRPETILGNIQNDSIEIIRNTLQEKNDQLLNEIIPKRKCTDCKLWKWCLGNLNMDSYSQNDTLNDDPKWCEARKDMVFNFILPRNCGA